MRRIRITDWIDDVFRYLLVLTWLSFILVKAEKTALPNFKDLRAHYPGYKHSGGQYRNHELLQVLELRDTSNLLIHDTSALRLSYTLNHIGGEHSLGTELIRLSKFGHDSVQGKYDMQYIFLPISFGPYLADKYGYPNISKLHLTDPSKSRHSFWGKQGIIRVITYTHHGNEPKGHVALWDCDNFYQSKDWIAGNTLVSLEFWESPDSSCAPEEEVAQSSLIPDHPVPSSHSNHASQTSSQSKLMSLMKNSGSKSRTNDLSNIELPAHTRHSSRLMRMKSGRGNT